MNHPLFLHNVFSFSHQLDVPFISWKCAIIILSIATQVPLFYYLPLTIWNFAKLVCMNHCPYTTTKHAMAHFFTIFLRFATTPCAYRCLFSTFTHNACNVMRGHRLLLRHSVKHYKTFFVKTIINCVNPLQIYIVFSYSCKEFTLYFSFFYSKELFILKSFVSLPRR